MAYLGYAFTLDGVRRSGIFALYGDKASARRMLNTLPGATTKVRYNPDHPDISLLARDVRSAFRHAKRDAEPGGSGTMPAIRSSSYDEDHRASEEKLALAKV